MKARRSGWSTFFFSLICFAVMVGELLVIIKLRTRLSSLNYELRAIDSQIDDLMQQLAECKAGQRT